MHSLATKWCSHYISKRTVSIFIITKKTFSPVREFYHIKKNIFLYLAKSLCAKGWQVCNPRHGSYLKLLTWEDVSQLDGCYAYNAANTLNQCARYEHY